MKSKNMKATIVVALSIVGVATSYFDAQCVHDLSSKQGNGEGHPPSFAEIAQVYDAIVHRLRTAERQRQEQAAGIPPRAHGDQAEQGQQPESAQNRPDQNQQPQQ